MSFLLFVLAFLKCLKDDNDIALMTHAVPINTDFYPDSKLLFARLRSYSYLDCLNEITKILINLITWKPWINTSSKLVGELQS